MIPIVAKRETKIVRLKPGVEVCCPDCRAVQGECILEPIVGASVSQVVTSCFKGFTTRDPPICKSCSVGVFYKPQLGFFTLLHGWTW